MTENTETASNGIISERTKISIRDAAAVVVLVLAISFWGWRIESRLSKIEDAAGNAWTASHEQAAWEYRQRTGSWLEPVQLIHRYKSIEGRSDG